VKSRQDNVVPYGADPANGQPGTYFIPAGGGSDALLELDDAPSTKSYHNSVTLDANYSDYIMFQPTIQNTIFAPLGGNTIYIPLGTVNWAISGTAYWSALYTITIDPKIQYGPSGPDSSTAFPSWVGIFSNQ